MVYLTLKRKLEKIYDGNIAIREGSSDLEIEYNVDAEKSNTKDIAVYINTEFKMVVIWDLKGRRYRIKDNQKLSHVLSVKYTWKKLSDDNINIKIVYKKIGKAKNSPYEKVIITSFELLDEIIYDLPAYLKFDPDDEEFPKDIKIEDYKNDILPPEIRNRISTSRWERDSLFRKAVLAEYDNKCAICRCSEPKILQAAHIIAVSEGGNDDPKNGICLCANHHLMYDNELIKIDFENLTLSDVATTVKSMPWYDSFVKDYDSKIAERKS